MKPIPKVLSDAQFDPTSTGVYTSQKYITKVLKGYSVPYSWQKQFVQENIQRDGEYRRWLKERPRYLEFLRLENSVQGKINEAKREKSLIRRRVVKSHR